MIKEPLVSSSPRSPLLGLLPFLLCLGVLSIAPHPVRAAGPDLRWIPSPSPLAIGYRLYVGFESGFYHADEIAATIDIGSDYTLTEGVASHPLSNLISGPSWVVMTAYDAEGRESPPSNQLFRELPQTCGVDADCLDGNLCNGEERCEAGTCSAGTSLVCEWADSCQVGRCDPWSGCVGDIVPDGTVCDDGDSATEADRCQAGVCYGVAPPPPEAPLPPYNPGPAPFYQSFDEFEVGADPSFWLDTGAGNSLVESDLFEVMQLPGGNKVFGTRSEQTNIHSHFLAPDGATWSGYEMRGRIRFSESKSGVGVTLYSDYPRTDAYYRLRRFGSGSFHLSPHPYGADNCVGRTDTGVSPSPETWYTFRFRVFEETPGTRLQAKVWPAAGEEPSGWQADCLDASTAALSGGSPGLWSMSGGEKYWDDLAVLPVASDSGILPEPSPECTSDAECSDGDVCTGAERCVAESCVAAAPLECGDPGLCGVTRCDVLLGCLVEWAADGTDCGAGDACTAPDTCRDGLCTAGGSLSCPDPGMCQVGSCDVVTGCESVPMPDGSACDDDDVATLNDVCSAGRCQGTLPPPPDEPTPEDPPSGESGGWLFDFEEFLPGESPPGWLDTDARNSLAEADHFEIFDLPDGSDANRVFGTRSRATNIHSHYVADDSDGWFDYELRGRMRISRDGAGIGVTLYSDYPASDSYYRLRHYGNKVFHLANHPQGEGVCEGSTETSLRPTAGIWYAFRFQAFDDQSETRVRAKVWIETETEPEGWEIDCLAPAEDAYFSGAPGLWSMSKGAKYWDDLEVIELDESTLP